VSAPVPELAAQDESRLAEAALRLWMERLLRHAARVGQSGEIPVAAVMLDERGRSIAWGSNRRQRDRDPLGHAELVCLARAARLRGDWRLNDCMLLVTLEPCPMCAGALVQARVGTVVYGAADPKRGALGSCLDLSSDPSAHHPMRVIGGVAEPEARTLLQSWFRRRRSQQRGAGSGTPAAPTPAD
jgi:tRNA(adenine34) deaminase